MMNHINSTFKVHYRLVSPPSKNEQVMRIQELLKIYDINDFRNLFLESRL